MAAGINDKFKKVSADNSYAVATAVKTARTVGGGTTLEAFDLSKWADATAVNFLTYRKTTDPVTNITTVTNRTGWTALVNTGSNTLTNLTVAPGYTDLGHQVGDYIEPVQMSKWANDLVDGILVTLNQDGTLKNKIATLGKIHGGSTAGVLTTDVSGNVSVKGNYSTSEADTNTKWTNGKTIYQRTFQGSHTTNTILTLWDSSPIDQIVRVEGYATFEGAKNAIPGTRFVGTSTTVYHNATVSLISQSNLALYTYGTTNSASTHAITIFYTKV